MNNLKRSMVFIDASNLLSGWWEYCRSNKLIEKNKETDKEFLTKKISYERLIKEVTKNTDFIRGYFYDATPEPIGSKKMRFFDMLRSNEITVVTKKLRYKSIKCKHCSKVDNNVPYQKGVDVSLVTDLMGLAFEKAYDTAIIVSGDNDFVDAVDHIKSKGLKVWIVSFRSCLGEDIMRVADKVIHLDKMFEKIVYK